MSLYCKRPGDSMIWRATPPPVAGSPIQEFTPTGVHHTVTKTGRSQYRAADGRLLASGMSIVAFAQRYWFDRDAEEVEA